MNTKKQIFGLIAVLVITLTSCKDNAANKVDEKNLAQAVERDAAAFDLPEIEFETKEFDFGNIIQGTPSEAIFKYKNVGKSLLVISDVKSSCGCTVPKDWTDKLEPGESGQFTAKFNGSGKGNVSKTITLTTNTEKGRETVKIKAFVEPDPNKENSKAANAVPAKPKTPAKTQTGHEGHNH